MNTKPLILVTGATGRTGVPAVRELLEHGYPVRAFVRRQDARSEALRQAGAEIFIGDLFDYRDLEHALLGVQRAYYCPPFAYNLLHGASLFALAAEEAKLEVVALMSQWQPHPTHGSVVSREHWMANNVFRWMPSVDVIHLNPGLFAFIYLLPLPVIVNLGMLPLPYGDGLNAPPSNEDIGRVAAGVLMNPEPHRGKSIRPTGPELISPTDVAEILTQVLGRRVKYQNSTTEMFLKAATVLGVAKHELAGKRHYAEDLRDGAYALGAPTSTVEEITGRTPESFEVIARRYLAEPDLIASGLKAGSKLGALGFLARMFMTRVPDLDGWEREQGRPILRDPVPAMKSPEWSASAARGSILLNADPVARDKPPA